MYKAEIIPYSSRMSSMMAFLSSLSSAPSPCDFTQAMLLKKTALWLALS
jgi:hypothetical protein